jgi:hypothetical protein
MEENRMIAEFMGYKYRNDLEINGWYLDYILIHETRSHWTLKFHTSWDWLMPVVEKIEDEGFNVIINKYVCKVEKVAFFKTVTVAYKEVADTESQTKLEAVYSAVVSFLKWYNENQIKNIER